MEFSCGGLVAGIVMQTGESAGIITSVAEDFRFRPGTARARPSEDGRYVTATRSGGLLLGLGGRRGLLGIGRRLGLLRRRRGRRLRLATRGRTRSLLRGGLGGADRLLCPR